MEGGTERGSTSAELKCTAHMEGGWVREGSTSAELRCSVHMEGGWDREGVNICRAEVYFPHGGRVGQRAGQHLQS